MPSYTSRSYTGVENHDHSATGQGGATLNPGENVTLASTKGIILQDGVGSIKIKSLNGDELAVRTGNDAGFTHIEVQNVLSAGTVDGLDVSKINVKTGTYTGDGNATQAIVGVGCAPKFVLVGRYNSGSVEAQDITTTQLIASTFSVRVTDGATLTTEFSALDADGFTVKTNLNVNLGTYYYVAFGS